MTSFSKKSVLLRELKQVAKQMIFGTISEVYRECGQPSCRCHQGEKHGPFMQVSYRGSSGKTTGYHVPRALEGRVREGVRAWQRFQELGRELAELNRGEAWEKHRQGGKKR
jgi:hypothetical protein